MFSGMLVTQTTWDRDLPILIDPDDTHPLQLLEHSGQLLYLTGSVIQLLLVLLLALLVLLFASLVLCDQGV